MKAIVLPLIVVFWSSASVGFAQTFTSGDWTYTLNGANEATITGYIGPGGAVVIPSSIDGNPVKHVGGGMFMNIFGGPNASVTSVAIPDGVMAIELSAFADSTALTSVTLPATLKSIGVYAFSGCTALGNLAIPNGVINIDAYAFQNCSALTSLEIPESVQTISDGAFSGCTGLTNVVIPLRFTAQIGTIGFTGQLATDLVADGLVEAIAQRVLAALPDNYGIATKADLGTAVSDATSQAIAQVQAAPNDYNLFSAAQYDENRTNGQTDVVSQPNTFGLFDSTQYEANRITGVAEGKAEVTSNPTAYNLFTESSIMDMNLGGLMLKKGADANELDLELTIETKDSLIDNEWQVAERIARKVSMDGVQRQFLRVRADAPYVAPNVKVLAHPTLGNILTDGAGRVLYYFAADSASGNPLFSGASWPYVTVPEAPKADAGVGATLASSTFGKPGGPYLTVNARPVYTYVGDAEAGQANGHGAGSVWWTIRADGVINQ